MKAITAIGIVCAFGALLRCQHHGRHEPDGLPQHSRAPAHRRRHVGRRHGVDELPDVHGDAQGDDHELQGLEHRVRRRHPGDGHPRREGPPQRPARARGGRRARSTTPTRRRAFSSSSTAPTRISSGRSSSRRSTAWRSGTVRSPACSRRPADSPRRSASSAPSWASSTCSRTCRRRRRWARDLGRVHRDALRRVERQPALPPVGNKLKEMSATEINHRYMVLEASSRSRPATTRACWPRSSRPTCRRPSAAPREKGAPAVAAVPDEERQAA